VTMQKPNIRHQQTPRLSLPGRGSPAARPRRAFTLMELIIVIGIILLLTALTVTVGVGVVAKSEVRATESTLKLLDLAVQEWETESGRKITWGREDEPPNATFDINPTTPQYVSDYDERTMLNIVLDKVQRNPTASDILRQIDGAYLKRVDATIDSEDVQVLEVLDAWEQPVYVIHPGRVVDTRTFNPSNTSLPNVDLFASQVVDTDEDGTIRVGADPAIGMHPLIADAGEAFAWENILGVCKNRRICFVSRGPDGDFGDLSADPDTNEYKATLDNVYSYPVEQP